ATIPLLCRPLARDARLGLPLLDPRGADDLAFVHGLGRLGAFHRRDLVFGASFADDLGRLGDLLRRDRPLVKRHPPIRHPPP
ncbi:hypothetical protein PMAYCL1PPCAC_22648, partial [Pristionchus mayeri]